MARDCRDRARGVDWRNHDSPAAAAGDAVDAEYDVCPLSVFLSVHPVLIGVFLFSNLCSRLLVVPLHSVQSELAANKGSLKILPTVSLNTSNPGTAAPPVPQRHGAGAPPRVSTQTTQSSKLRANMVPEMSPVILPEIRQLGQGVANQALRPGDSNNSNNSLQEI